MGPLDDPRRAVLSLPARVPCSRRSRRAIGPRRRSSSRPGRAGAPVPGVLAHTARWRSSSRFCRAGASPPPWSRPCPASLEDLVHNPYGRDYMRGLHELARAVFAATEPAVAEPAAAGGGRAPARPRQVHQSGRALRHRRDPGGSHRARSLRSTSPTPISRCSWPGPGRSTWMTRRAPGNTSPSRPCRSPTARQSEAAMRAFTMARGGIQIPAKSTETAQRLSQLETTLAEVQANRNISQARLATLKAKPEAAATPVPQDRGARLARRPGDRSQCRERPRLRAKLSSLEAQMVEAKTRYSEDHPRVRSLAQQIGEVQRELGDAVKESRSRARSRRRSGRRRPGCLCRDGRRLETSVVSLPRRRSALKDQAAAPGGTCPACPRTSSSIGASHRTWRPTGSCSTLLSDKLGAARIREQGEMNVVKVIDPARLPGASAPTSGGCSSSGWPSLLGPVDRPRRCPRPRSISTGRSWARTTSSSSPVCRSSRRCRRCSFGQARSSARSDDQARAKQEEYHLFVDSFRRLRVELQMIGGRAAPAEDPGRQLLCRSRASPRSSLTSAWPSERWESG